MRVGFIIESLRRDFTLRKNGSVELRHFESMVVVRPEAGGEHDVLFYQIIYDTLYLYMPQFSREHYQYLPEECPLCHEYHNGSDLCLWSGNTLAISRNKFPYNQDPNHLLIYPKRHIKRADEMTGEEYAEFPEIHRVLNEILGREHTIMLRNAIGSLDHLHYHVFPVNMYGRQIEEVMRHPRSQPKKTKK